MAKFTIEFLSFTTEGENINEGKFNHTMISEFTSQRTNYVNSQQLFSYGKDSQQYARDLLNDDIKEEDIINYFENQQEVYCFSYDEKFTLHKHSQCTLTFKMDKMVLKGDSWTQNPYIDILKIGSLILLTDRYDNKFLMNVIDISYDIKEHNTTYSFSCEDNFTYSLNSQNCDYSIDNDPSSDTFIGAKSIDWWAYKIWDECKLSYKYLPLEWNWEKHAAKNGEKRNEIYPEALRVKQSYTKPTDNDVENENYLLFQTTSFSGSGSANSLLISLAERYGMMVIVRYNYDYTNNKLSKFFWFEVDKSNKNNGLVYSPYSDVQSFSLKASGENLTSVLRVKGGSIGDDLITMVPEVPTFFSQLYLSPEWKPTGYYNGMFSKIVQTNGVEIIDTITSVNVEYLVTINADNTVDIELENYQIPPFYDTFRLSKTTTKTIEPSFIELRKGEEVVSITNEFQDFYLKYYEDQEANWIMPQSGSENSFIIWNRGQDKMHFTFDDQTGEIVFNLDSASGLSGLIKNRIDLRNEWTKYTRITQDIESEFFWTGSSSIVDEVYEPSSDYIGGFSSYYDIDDKKFYLLYMKINHAARAVSNFSRFEIKYNASYKPFSAKIRISEDQVYFKMNDSEEPFKLDSYFQRDFLIGSISEKIVWEEEYRRFRVCPTRPGSDEECEDDNFIYYCYPEIVGDTFYIKEGEQIPSNLLGKKDFKFFIHIPSSIPLEGYDDFDVDNYNLFIEWYRTPTNEEVEYASIADNCPWLENSLIDFSYYTKNSLINKATYNKLTDYITNKLRFINGKLSVFIKEYYAALHRKTQTIADITNKLDLIGANVNSTIIDFFADQGTIGDTLDTSQLFKIYTDVFSNNYKRTSMLGYKDTLSSYVNKYIDANQRFLKNMYQFEKYFNQGISFGSDDFGIWEYLFEIKPKDDDSSIDRVFSGHPITQVIGDFASSCYNLETGKPYKPLYKQILTGKTYSRINDNDIVDKENLQTSNKFYVLKELNQYTEITDGMIKDLSKPYKFNQKDRYFKKESDKYTPVTRSEIETNFFKEDGKAEQYKELSNTYYTKNRETWTKVQDVADSLQDGDFVKKISSAWEHIIRMVSALPYAPSNTPLSISTDPTAILLWEQFRYNRNEVPIKTLYYKDNDTYNELPNTIVTPTNVTSFYHMSQGSPSDFKGKQIGFSVLAGYLAGPIWGALVGWGTSQMIRHIFENKTSVLSHSGLGFKNLDYKTALNKMTEDDFIYINWNTDDVSHLMYVSSQQDFENYNDGNPSKLKAYNFVYPTFENFLNWKGLSTYDEGDNIEPGNYFFKEKYLRFLSLEDIISAESCANIGVLFFTPTNILDYADGKINYGKTVVDSETRKINFVNNLGELLDRNHSQIYKTTIGGTTFIRLGATAFFPVDELTQWNFFAECSFNGFKQIKDCFVELHITVSENQIATEKKEVENEVSPYIYQMSKDGTTVYFVMFEKEDFNYDELKAEPQGEGESTIYKWNYSKDATYYRLDTRQRSDLIWDNKLIGDALQGYYYKVGELKDEDVVNNDSLRNINLLNYIERYATDVLSEPTFYKKDSDGNFVEVYSVPQLIDKGIYSYKNDNHKTYLTTGKQLEFDLPICKYQEEVVTDESGQITTIITNIGSINYLHFNFENDTLQVDEDSNNIISMKVSKKVDFPKDTSNGAFWYYLNNVNTSSISESDIPRDVLNDLLLEYSALIETELTQYWTVAHTASLYSDYFIPESWKPQGDGGTTNFFGDLVIVPIDNLKSTTPLCRLSRLFVPSVEKYAPNNNTSKKYLWKYANENNTIQADDIREFIGYNAEEYTSLEEAYAADNLGMNNIKDTLTSWGVLEKDSEGMYKDWTLIENGYGYYYGAQSGGVKWSDLFRLMKVPNWQTYKEVDGWYPMFIKYLAKRFYEHSTTNYEALRKQQTEIWRQIYTLFPGLVLEKTYTNEDAITSKELYTFAKQYFKDLVEPEYGYNVTMIDVSQLKQYSGQELKIGDSILLNVDEISSEFDDVYRALSKYLFISDISYDLRKDSDIAITVNTVKYGDKLVQRLAKLIR